jgi:hypothetical protein
MCFKIRNKADACKVEECIHSFIYSHSINPDLVTKTMDMELVKNNNVINILHRCFVEDNSIHYVRLEIWMMVIVN